MDQNNYNPDDLVVESFERRMTLNPRFLTQQNAWGNLEKLKQCFSMKFHIMDMMEQLEDEADIRIMDRTLQDIEFRIQELFNFPPNKNFHRFWERPHCTCPRLDNQDSWGTNHIVVNMGCIVHGKAQEIRKEEKRLFDTYFRPEFIGANTPCDSNDKGDG